MTTIKRSARLMNMNKLQASQFTPHDSRQNKETWERRSARNAALASDDLDEENNENFNDINRIKNKHSLKMTDSAVCSSRSSYNRKKREYFSSTESEDDDKTNEEVRKSSVSPRKQPRKPFHKSSNQLISPTRLLDRLSIDERVTGKEEKKDISIDDSIKKISTRNKYQNARRVLNSAETQNLPGREEQLKELREFLMHHLETDSSGSLYVSGQPGTGKTASISLLLHEPIFKNRFQQVFINCTSLTSSHAIYKKLCSKLNLTLNGRCNEREYINAIKKYLKTSSRIVLIVLDEIDQLCNARQSVLYTIFEWPVEINAKVLIVGIANNLDLTERALMRLNLRCELKPKTLHFPPYTKQQIVEIFKSRLQEANVLDIFPPVTLQLLAAKVSSISGDIRRALDIGRRVVEIAEQQTRDECLKVILKEVIERKDNEFVEEEKLLKPVQINQVATVLKNVYGVSQNLQEDLEESFPLQQKIVLCSLMLILRNERHKDINLGRLHDVYQRLCKKRNIQSVDQGEFSSLVDLVETRGILRIMRKKEPRNNKIVLQWDEEEVNETLKDKQLIASILNDTSCLKK